MAQVVFEDLEGACRPLAVFSQFAVACGLWALHPSEVAQDPSVQGHDFDAQH